MHETHGTAGRQRGLSHPGPSRGGQLVDPAGPWTYARIPRDCWSTPQAIGSERESQWTQQVHGPMPEYPGTAGRPHGPLDLSTIRLGELFDPRALGHRPELPGTAGRHRGPSGPGLSRPGRLIDPAGLLTSSRVSWGSCSTPRALGPGPEWPVTAGQPRKVSDKDPRRPGQLIDPAGPRTQPQVARESWSPCGPLDSSTSQPG